MKTKTILITSIFSLLSFSLSFAQNKVLVEQINCYPDTIDYNKFRERIIKQDFSKDTLKIILGIRYNRSPIIEASYIIKNDTLKINYHNIAETIMCHCFQEFIFKIPNIKQDYSVITFNDYEFEHTDQVYSIYEKQIDTLKNGVILHRHYENGKLIKEYEKNDTAIILRQYIRGKFTGELVRSK